MKRLTTVLLFVCVAATSNGQDVSAKELEKNKDFKSLINSIISWGEIGNAKGVQGEMRLVTRSTKNGLDYTTYEMYTTGLPRNQSYALFSWAINQAQPEVVSPVVYITPNGTLCSAKDQCKEKSNVIFGFISTKGEPHRLALISKDGHHTLMVKVIPDPITGSDQGCNLEVIRATPKFEGAIIRGKGFKPNETIHYVSDSAGEVMTGEVGVQGDGTFVLVLAPFVKGKDIGVDTVKLQGKACAPTIKYKWGTSEE